jgi:hypothetical protein
MLKIRICNALGDDLAGGTCSDSGFFPPAVAGIYNDALGLLPRRTLQSCDTSSDSGDYPEGIRRARFGYTQLDHHGADLVLDDEVIFHVERV